jgi:hypothetical protein
MNKSMMGGWSMKAFFSKKIIIAFSGIALASVVILTIIFLVANPQKDALGNIDIPVGEGFQEFQEFQEEQPTEEQLEEERLFREQVSKEQEKQSERVIDEQVNSYEDILGIWVNGAGITLVFSDDIYFIIDGGVNIEQGEYKMTGSNTMNLVAPETKMETPIEFTMSKAEYEQDAVKFVFDSHYFEWAGSFFRYNDEGHPETL